MKTQEKQKNRYGVPRLKDYALDVENQENIRRELETYKQFLNG